jgi:hypothetical protein
MQLLPVWPFRLRCPAVLREQKDLLLAAGKAFRTGPCSTTGSGFIFLASIGNKAR